MYIKMGINILNVFVEIFYMGKRFSGFVVLNKVKEGLFLYKIFYLIRIIWCIIVFYKLVMF